MFRRISGITLFLLVLALTIPAWAAQDSPNPQDWLDRAQADLDVAKLVSEKTTHYEEVCFLAHQTVEKSLMGALISHGSLPGRTHLTGELLSELARFRPELASSLPDCRALDRLYVPSRYPKVGITFPKEAAADCLQKATALFESVKKATAQKEAAKKEGEKK